LGGSKVLDGFFVFLCIRRWWCYAVDMLDSYILLALYDHHALETNGLRSEILGAPRGGSFSIGTDFSHNDKDLLCDTICLRCRRRDFQQLSGRSVVVGVAIMWCC